MFELDQKNKINYEITNETYVEEENLSIVELTHIKTKCKIVLMICNDKNRVFNIAFKTPVENNKGIPHILEHSVLCGSRKYNVKDPFIELAKTSVNTFLNAMTFPDKTCYPIASANLKDFHNLVDVYLDAVFYPNAVKNDKIYRQEGWHYEIDGIDDDLKVNGVVLNEMKGVYSNPDEILESAILKNTYYDTNYAYDYGGNPDDIIKLSFDEFKEFHRKYYSPSNAIIYFYGKLDYNRELTYINDEYLNNFEYIDIDARFLDVKAYKKDNIMETYYNVDENDIKNKAYLTYNFSIDKDKSSLNKIVITILDYILFSSESAILRNKFLDEGFGESMYTTSEFGLKNGLYSVIAQNIDESKKELWTNNILSEIENIVENGIEKDRILAAINSLYFSCIEGEYGRTPRGLVLILTSLDTYLYGGKVSSYIEYKKDFEYIRNIDLEDKNNIFYKTLKKLFLENEHRTINVLLPKNGYILENDNKLKSLLKEKKESLNNKEIEKIITDCKELKDFQKAIDSDSDFACIPTLTINDLEEQDSIVSFDRDIVSGVETIVNYENDKEIVYLSISVDVTDISREELYLLSIINRLLSKIDLKNMTYSELDNYIDINTGGIEIKFDVYENKLNFTIGVKSLVEKCNVAFDIIFNLVKNSIFEDKKRIEIILNEIKANALVSILSKGHLTAIDRSASTISYVSLITDRVSSIGIASYKFLNSFIDNYKDNADLLNEAIALLYKKIFTKKMYFELSVNKKYKNEVFAEFAKFYNKMFKDGAIDTFSDEYENKLRDCIIKIKTFIPFDSFEMKCNKEAIIVPSDVNFVAISNTFDKNEFSGRLVFLKTLFNYEYLWTNIRVLGGAYGCMSNFRRTGIYTFTSYRDPNLKKTNETFYGIYDYLKSIDLSSERIEKYIIGSTAAYDNPTTILTRFKNAITSYFNGVNDSDLKKERKELISMNEKDLKNTSNVFVNIANSKACAIIGDKVAKEALDFYDKVWNLVE